MDKLNLSFEGGQVSASDSMLGAIVAVRQGAELQPVVFESKMTPVQYDPNQPLTVFVKTLRSDFWQVLSVEYTKGTLSWWQTKEAPTK